MAFSDIAIPTTGALTQGTFDTPRIMPLKPLGHRDIFGKRLSWDAICSALEPYHQEEVIIVLTSLAALTAHPEAQEPQAQQLLIHAFFLESAEKVTKKIKANTVVFHRPQILVAQRLAAQRCKGDAVTQPMGAAFFEGIAKILVGITDHLKSPSAPPALSDKAPAKSQLLVHLNHLLQVESLEPVDIQAQCLRAYQIVFERAPKLSRHRAFVNLPGAFHEKNGVQCERWFAVCLHLLAKALNYSLATMHENQPVVRISADFRESPLESRQLERLFAPISFRPGRVRADPLEPKMDGRRDPLHDHEVIRWRPVYQTLDDTYAACDPHLLSSAIAGDIGARLVACSADRHRARHWWTSLIRDHAERHLAPLTAPLRGTDRIHRDASGRPRPIADWFHVRGKDAVLLWTVTASVRRDFATDEDMTNHNTRLVRGILEAAREMTTTVEAWRAGLCDPCGKKIGQVKRIFPVIILERDIPQDITLHRLLAKAMKDENLLGDALLQPLRTIDLSALEILASRESPPWLVPLIAKWSESPQKNQPLIKFMVKEGYPAKLETEDSAITFDKLVKRLRKSIGVL